MSEEDKKINFETAMKQLEEIANQLEKNELDLDEAVAKFEEGMKLSKKCSEILENAEKKITILINDGKDNFSEEKFETE
ncbi:MAG: exodeoxyribonuclease VII small subunit [Clostridia bacterium]|nr:exodeoxyribonuclease VII small subunit [Clostridia bacterium]